ncbi:GIY-YIG nuclease family protein [Salmonirosea aquatica]|uniref:GIY-YIG domain-containing protein n=1 Tax=Salmonirosea aquatica TaxID=2654236 RepID=A0A7C9BIN4_9BACT|nr:hypothetical protein [Cytophagaceae bacterium SJW1-29]
MSSNIINHLGFQFDDAISVQGRYSISDLFPPSKNRCGIYLLNFSDSTFYIGQAIDVVRRFSQHRKNYDTIYQLWFLPVKKENLNDVEQKLIFEAEKLGLLLINKTFVSNILGDTDLDLIISPLEQENWLTTNTHSQNEVSNIYSVVNIKHRVKYRHNFEKLRQVPIYIQLKRILNFYLVNCLPAHKMTELSFWSLSCLPSTNANTFPRYISLNINAMEALVMGYEKKTKTEFCFVVLSRRLFNRKTDLKNLHRKYSTMRIFESKYRAGGSDQVRFEFSNLIEFESFLTTNSLIINSIKNFNLRLMRKGGTIYSPFHCFDLVRDILS